MRFHFQVPFTHFDIFLNEIQLEHVWYFKVPLYNISTCWCSRLHTSNYNRTDVQVWFPSSCYTIDHKDLEKFNEKSLQHTSLVCDGVFSRMHKFLLQGLLCHSFLITPIHCNNKRTTVKDCNRFYSLFTLVLLNILTKQQVTSSNFWLRFEHLQHWHLGSQAVYGSMIACNSEHDAFTSLWFWDLSTIMVENNPWKVTGKTL